MNPIRRAVLTLLGVEGGGTDFITDIWSRLRTSSESASMAEAVTPSNTVALPGGPCRALYIGVAGDVTIVTLDHAGAEATVLFTAVPVGVLPVGCSRVNATATTASSIVALY